GAGSAAGAAASGTAATAASGVPAPAVAGVVSGMSADWLDSGAGADTDWASATRDVCAAAEYPTAATATTVTTAPAAKGALGLVLGPGPFVDAGTGVLSSSSSWF